MQATVMYLVISASIALKLENNGPKTKQSYFKAEVVAFTVESSKCYKFADGLLKFLKESPLKKIEIFEK